MFAEGKGVKQDFTEAVIWLGKAADQNVYSAQNSLGMLYIEGKGVPQDWLKASNGWEGGGRQLRQGPGNLARLYLHGPGGRRMTPGLQARPRGSRPELRRRPKYAGLDVFVGRAWPGRRRGSEWLQRAVDHNNYAEAQNSLGLMSSKAAA